MLPLMLRLSLSVRARGDVGVVDGKEVDGKEVDGKEEGREVLLLRVGVGEGVTSVEGEISTSSASRYHFRRRV